MPQPDYYYDNPPNTADVKTVPSGYTGIYWDKHHQKYRAGLCRNNRTLWIGTYDSIKEAVCARNKLALSLGLKDRVQSYQETKAV